MAREATITQEQVSDAAERIRAAGGKVTARAIREELGSGSMATVLKHLQVWQSTQLNPPEGSQALPVALQRALSEYVTQEVEAATAAAKSDLAVAQQANTDLIRESERLARDLETSERELDGLRLKHAEVLGRMNQLTTDLEASRVDTETQRQLVVAAKMEAAKQQLRLDDLPKLQENLERLQATLDIEREQRITAEQLAAVTSARFEQTEALLGEMRKS